MAGLGQDHVARTRRCACTDEALRRRGCAYARSGRAIQLMIGIAGNTQPIPATT
jgi:hypothetical protein